MLEQLRPLMGEIVLIGGQALSFWAERYKHAPELAIDAPYTSKDLDFYGGADQVTRCAAELGGIPKLYGPKQRSPCAGIVTTAAGLEIDFVHTPRGVKPSELKRRAISFDHVRVMHPVHVLMSRAANVVHIPRVDPHSLGQLRAAVFVLREFTREVLGHGDVKPARQLNEEAFRLAMAEDGLTVWRRHAIDVFAAVLTAPELGAGFLENMYPRMRDQLAALRA